MNTILGGLFKSGRQIYHRLCPVCKSGALWYTTDKPFPWVNKPTEAEMTAHCAACGHTFAPAESAVEAVRWYPDNIVSDKVLL